MHDLLHHRTLYEQRVPITFLLVAIGFVAMIIGGTGPIVFGAIVLTLALLMPLVPKSWPAPQKRRGHRRHEMNNRRSGAEKPHHDATGQNDT